LEAGADSIDRIAVAGDESGMTVALTSLQALELWRHALTAAVRREAPDLSSRQIALLLTIYLTPAPHTVRGLSSTLHISKPAVTRALDRLGELGLTRRTVDTADRRNVLIERTEAGQSYLDGFADLVRQAASMIGVAA
jgi:DNA-binding MarR family transcriptional regulator